MRDVLLMMAKTLPFDAILVLLEKGIRDYRDNPHQDNLENVTTLSAMLFFNGISKHKGLDEAMREVREFTEIKKKMEVHDPRAS